MNTLLMLAADDQSGSRVLGIVLIGLAVLGFLVLILPGIIAATESIKKKALWAVTIFLGRTFIAGVIAFVWAFTQPPNKQHGR